MTLDFIINPSVKVPMLIASVNHLQTEAPPLLDLINQHREKIIEQLNLYGAVLFRGFACQDADTFSKAIELCGLGARCSTSDYELPRTVLPNEIYTSSDLPGHIPLPLHHEKPRTANPPNHVYFCCVTQATQGGGTLLANAEAIWQDMPHTIQDKIKKHGVQYKQYFHAKSFKYDLIKKILSNASARSWAEYFGTEEKIDLDNKFTQENCHWTWVNKGRDLVLSNNLPGALKHPITNKLLWFNSSAYLNYYSNLIYGELKTLSFYKYLASRYLILKDSFPLICHYGNGHAFSANEIDEIIRIIQHHTCVLDWQKGDFIIVDNYTFMHGKQAHEGDRLLYSCMTKT
jgi:alpha-ketoglutarate-dependent taurine dioxygenase